MEKVFEYVMNGKMTFERFMTGLNKVVILMNYQLIELILMEIMNHQIADGFQKKANQIIERLPDI